MAEQSGPSGKQQETGEIDVSALSEDKIKQLMRSDPRFITRLINQLDKSMHGMMAEKTRRQEQIRADEAELEKLDTMVKTHIQPNLDRLDSSIKEKTAMRDNLSKQMEQQTGNLKQMERDAAALISGIRSRAGKLQKATASLRLEEARGFSASVPTSQLVKGGTAKSKPAGS